jgi:hypothetical protein
MVGYQKTTVITVIVSLKKSINSPKRLIYNKMQHPYYVTQVMSKPS